MSLSTHILDTSTGMPAVGMNILLSTPEGGEILEKAVSDSDGRYRFTIAPEPGTYVLKFDTGDYYAAQGIEGLYPWVDITFIVAAEGPSHLHIPLLLSPFGFTTYRGS